ncbi:MAG: InlB B-repeat-containing protein, partial [Gaiellaceae bacterium]
MHRIGSRCGTESPGRLRPRSTILAVVPLLATLLAIVPASAAPERAAGSATVVVHGQGRVTSDPAGEIDCPGRCVLTFAGVRNLTLRATPSSGWAVADNALCGAAAACTVPLADNAYNLDVFFRPAAKLQVWPNGDGAVAVSPTPVDERGLPLQDPCTPATVSVTSGCDLFYVPGTDVVATATPAAGSSFLGWSARECPGSRTCALRLDRERTSLTARFSPLELRIRLGGLATGTIRSEPPGIACPPTCEAPFPYGSRVALIAVPDPATPFVGWKFGCSVSSTDPLRCTTTLTNRPTWVGVALGADDQIGVPATLSVLFAVTREGQGVVSGRELSCGVRCESEYTFGEPEELRAQPASGWRFGGWDGACGRQSACALHVGPVT